MPHVKRITPVLLVSSMERSVQFYTQVLGFEVCWRAPDDGDGESCMLEIGDASVLLSTGSHLGDSPKFSGTLYFDTVGVAEFYKTVKDKVDLVWPLEKMGYGQTEFGLRDPDGYVLAFAEGDGE
jgi:uncharacterized glyoxalase superfamily protein PhnB